MPLDKKLCCVIFGRFGKLPRKFSKLVFLALNFRSDSYQPKLFVLFKRQEHLSPSFSYLLFLSLFQGVGGSVQLPKGFLKGAYELIRERGGVCISDEVYCSLFFCHLQFDYWKDRELLLCSFIGTNRIRSSRHPLLGF